MQEELRAISLDRSGALLKYARRLQKVQGIKTDCRIAVLGSCSIQYFVQILKVLLYRDGICAEFYEGTYDGIRTDILNGDSGFYRFAPDIAVILTDYRDIRTFPAFFANDEQVRNCVNSLVEEHRQLWDTLQERLPECQIMMSNYVVPLERALGNLEYSFSFSRQSIFRRLNEALAKSRPSYVLLADLEYLAAALGKLEWFDASAYALAKLPFALKYTGYAADLFAKLIGACRGNIRKCLILDLDNTLWGGVVSEEGPRGIHVGPEDAQGEVFRSFQEYVKRLRERGVILAVCSKNEEAVAREPFATNPYMILEEEDFAAFYANWDDKAANIRKIAEEIGIGTDSMVFFDDNPVERELVKMQLPEVAVFEVPTEPADYVKALEMAGYFHWSALTPEDGARSMSYAAEKKRECIRAASDDYSQYLQRLEMTGSVRMVNADMVRRFSQLVNKSNQFNLRTRRYTEAEVSAMLQRDDCILLAGSLSDKFSSYGIIACVILQKFGEVCFIDTWVMSCRVLKRGFEYLVFEHILRAAGELGCTVLEGEYIPTSKNGMVESLLPEIGFVLDDADNRYRYQSGTDFHREYYIAEE